MIKPDEKCPSWLGTGRPASRPNAADRQSRAAHPPTGQNLHAELLVRNVVPYQLTDEFDQWREVRRVVLEYPFGEPARVQGLSELLRLKPGSLKP